MVVIGRGGILLFREQTIERRLLLCRLPQHKCYRQFLGGGHPAQIILRTQVGTNVTGEPHASGIIDRPANAIALGHQGTGLKTEEKRQQQAAGPGGKGLYLHDCGKTERPARNWRNDFRDDGGIDPVSESHIGRNPEHDNVGL